jgi:GLPGLI family protein
MKWLTFIVAGFILSSAANAQAPDTALLLIHYKFSHIRDTTNRAAPFKEDMVLAVGKKAGVYRSYEHQLSVAQTKKYIQQQTANAAGGPVMLNIHVTGSSTEYFQYPNDRLLFRKEHLVSTFLVTGSLPVIDWQVTADTASFGELHCQKAMGHFKGRDYIAWFCPDLPLHLGPWKLTGLPGVIVEAYDTKKEVQFLFDGIEKAGPLAKADDQSAAQTSGAQGGPPPMPGTEEFSNDPNLIQLPDKATKTTDKEFARLQEAFQKDPNAFAQSMMAAHNSGMPGDNGPKMKMDIKAGPQPVINNPIELPEKQ